MYIILSTGLRDAHFFVLNSCTFGVLFVCRVLYGEKLLLLLLLLYTQHPVEPCSGNVPVCASVAESLTLSNKMQKKKKREENFQHYAQAT